MYPLMVSPVPNETPFMTDLLMLAETVKSPATVSVQTAVATWAGDLHPTLVQHLRIYVPARALAPVSAAALARLLSAQLCDEAATAPAETQTQREARLAHIGGVKEFLARRALALREMGFVDYDALAPLDGALECVACGELATQAAQCGLASCAHHATAVRDAADTSIVYAVAAGEACMACALEVADAPPSDAPLGSRARLMLCAGCACRAGCAAAPLRPFDGGEHAPLSAHLRAVQRAVALRCAHPGLREAWEASLSDAAVSAATATYTAFVVLFAGCDLLRGGGLLVAAEHGSAVRALAAALAGALRGVAPNLEAELNAALHHEKKGLLSDAKWQRHRVLGCEEPTHRALVDALLADDREAAAAAAAAGDDDGDEERPESLWTTLSAEGTPHATRTALAAWLGALTLAAGNGLLATLKEAMAACYEASGVRVPLPPSAPEDALSTGVAAFLGVCQATKYFNSRFSRPKVGAAEVLRRAVAEYAQLVRTPELLLSYAAERLSGSPPALTPFTEIKLVQMALCMLAEAAPFHALVAELREGVTLGDGASNGLGRVATTGQAHVLLGSPSVLKAVVGNSIADTANTACAAFAGAQLVWASHKAGVCAALRAASFTRLAAQLAALELPNGALEGALCEARQSRGYSGTRKPGGTSTRKAAAVGGGFVVDDGEGEEAGPVSGDEGEYRSQSEETRASVYDSESDEDDE